MRGNEYEMISKYARGMIPDDRLCALIPHWPQSREVESAACRSRKGLRDIVPASDLEPFRSSPWKMVWA